MNIVDSVKRKLNKGFYLVQRYSYGIPYWRFEKGKTVSGYPRVNEDIYCDLLSEKVIVEHRCVRDNIRYYKLNNLFPKI